MRIGTTGAGARADRRGHRRGRWQRTCAFVLSAALGLGAIGCSTTPEASSATSVPPTSPDAAATERGTVADQVPIGTLDQRPVLAMLPPDAANGVDVLRDTMGAASYLVGPVEARQPAILSATAQEGVSNRWEVAVVFAPGADGIDLFNEQARRCFERGPTCPTGQLALLFESLVVSAPRIQPDQTAFTPFAADEIVISGPGSEAEARDLALALRAP